MESLQTALPYLREYSYAGVFLLILAFSVTPLSKTLVIAAAGVLAGRGIGELPIYFMASSLALLLADLGYYLLGRVFKARIEGGTLMLEPSRAVRLARAGELFRHHAWEAVFSARFLPFVRSLIFIVAGMNRMPLWGFVSADLLSAFIYVPLALALGYLLGSNLDALVATEGRARWWLAAAVLLISLGIIWVRRRRR